MDILLWAFGTLLVILGVIKVIRNINKSTASLLAAGFLGILLSIPFLPPIDSGTRFYASTMPFYYAIPAFAQAEFIPNKLRFPNKSLLMFSYLYKLFGQQKDDMLSFTTNFCRTLRLQPTTNAGQQPGETPQPEHRPRSAHRSRSRQTPNPSQDREHRC